MSAHGRWLLTLNSSVVQVPFVGCWPSWWGWWWPSMQPPVGTFSACASLESWSSLAASMRTSQTFITCQAGPGQHNASADCLPCHQGMLVVGTLTVQSVPAWAAWSSPQHSLLSVAGAVCSRPSLMELNPLACRQTISLHMHGSLVATSHMVLPTRHSLCV